ncbi:uncharacterized protein B0I36DRAFT_324605 [Microdochium trichocladiopsis]|uniref:DUF7136 domain-containing protein n=1 Tax=Microdochium trichocladiopsis TaxID=1682393 RepID=A0A9P9BSG0_9PEZI|nr:uncharacterized protein B0I36DRAFT_324605 [Microdochium trichocladiopsis]KAH7028811.1 hypothetical protein B0I36DRAFT_324605 [Microdochium trichocladiopsis]
MHVPASVKGPLLLAGTCLMASSHRGLASAAEHFGKVDMSLVFPQNETYQPTALFPIVFAFQFEDPKLPESIIPSITLNGWKTKDNKTEMEISTVVDGMRWVDWGNSSGLHWQYRPFTRFNDEASWFFRYVVAWSNCSTNETSTGGIQDSDNFLRGVITFNISKADGKPVDLVGATSEESCEALHGSSSSSGEIQHAVSVNVASVIDAPQLWAPEVGPDFCGQLDESAPLGNPSPCQARMDRAAEESIQASMTSWACSFRDVPDGIECPAKDEEGSALSSMNAVAGAVLWSSIATVLGGIVFHVL